jgi:hypothetical protein
MQDSSTLEIQKLMELVAIVPCDCIETMPKPSIAAVNGFALGGEPKYRRPVMSDLPRRSGFSVSRKILIGITPLGGTQRLPRMVGWVMPRN